jgi:hypothetical protein
MDFPENDVELMRDYVGTRWTQKPSEKIGAVRTALGSALHDGSHGIQEHNPFPPHNLINIAAVRRRNARIRVSSLLGNLNPILDQLDDVYMNAAKQEFGLAANLLATIPSRASNVTAAEIAEAFATTSLGYINIRGSAAEPIIENFTQPGYSGPVLDAQELLAAQQLVAGGAERDFQLGLLGAEINVGKHDIQSLLQAIQAYGTLLPEMTTNPTDMFGVHLELFGQFSSLDDVTVRQQFVALRAAFAHLALGDQFFRKQRALSDEQHQSITDVYDAAVRLVEQIGIAPANPRRQEVQTYAAQQKAKLQNRLNYLGLWDAFVPVQRYSQMAQDAADLIRAAQGSAEKYQSFLNFAEQGVLEQMDVQFQQAQENGNLEILNIRQNNATLNVSKIDEQLSAIDDQRAALGGELAFKAYVDAVATGITTRPPQASGIISGLGIVSAVVHASAQDTELAHQRRMAEIEREIARNQDVIASLERDLSQQRIAFFAQKRDFLGNKALNADFLYSLAELNRRRAERQLGAAIFLAYLFERALAFFLGVPSIRKIQFDYLDRPGRILDVVGALNADFLSVLTERDKPDAMKFDFFEQSISLRESYPIQFSRFLQTGIMDFNFSLYQLSKLRPASHQCRLREVGVEIIGLIPPTGFSGTLTHRGRFLVRDKTATLVDPAATRLIPTDAQLAQALEEQRQQGLGVAAVGGILLYDLPSDTKELSLNTQFVSHEPPNQDTLNIFEGHGPTGLWHLEIQDLEQLRISDIVLHFAIVSRASDVDVLEPTVLDLIGKFEAELAEGDSLDRISGFSLLHNFRDAFSALQTGPATVNLAQENFPSGLTHLQFKMVIVQALDQQGKGVPNISLEIGRPDVPPPGFNQALMTRSDGFSEDLDAPPQTRPRDQRFPVIGAWQIRLRNPAQFAQLGDLRLYFMYAFEKL